MSLGVTSPRNTYIYSKKDAAMFGGARINDFRRPSSLAGPLGGYCVMYVNGPNLASQVFDAAARNRETAGLCLMKIIVRSCEEWKKGSRHFINWEIN